MKIDNWIALFGMISGVSAFGVALSQYIKTQQWKRAEFVASEYKLFVSKQAVKNALLMLDWNVRAFELPDKRKVTITDEQLSAALVPHNKRPAGFTDTEVFIRDTFDELLEGLQVFSHYIESGLVSFDEFRTYLIYWVEILADKNSERKPAEFYDSLWSFIDYYGYSGVQTLCKGYGYSRKGEIMRDESKCKATGENKALSIIALIISIVAIVFTGLEYKRAERVNKVSDYLHLREQFYDTIKNIKSEYKTGKLKSVPADSPDWNAIARYWYFTFDEWYVTEHLNDSDLKELWSNYYEKVIVEAGKIPAYRQVACTLINNQFQKNKLQQEYAEVLKRMLKEGNPEVCITPTKQP